PVRSLDADGASTLRGTATLGNDELALDGKLSGEHRAATDGFVQVLGGTAETHGVIETGSRVKVDVSDAKARIRLGPRPGFAGGSAAGRVSGAVGVGDLSLGVDTAGLGLDLAGS